MLKMKDVYTQNSQLGDPMTIEKQLEENAQKLDQLRQEIVKYEVKSLVHYVFYLSLKLFFATWLVRWSSRAHQS